MNPQSIILKVTARLMVFFINIFALYIMVRGHNNPGGGFIAGLISSISIVLLSMSLGVDELKKIIRVDPVLFAVVGLLLAYGTSLAPTFFDLPFLKHSFVMWHHVPLLGDVHVGTPLLFDLGVYLVVIGVTCKIMVKFFYLIFASQEYLMEETFLYASSSDESLKVDEQDD